MVSLEGPAWGQESLKAAFWWAGGGGAFWVSMCLCSSFYPSHWCLQIVTGNVGLDRKSKQHKRELASRGRMPEGAWRYAEGGKDERLEKVR